MPIDRIENHRHEKNIKLFKWLAGMSLVLAILRIYFTPDLLNGGVKMADFAITLIPIGLFIQYRRTSKRWGGQFIEWRENEISFKSRKYDITTISLTEIISIAVRLDLVEITTAEHTYVISIEDYTEYKDRVRLKDNFKKVKEKTKHNKV